MFDGLIGVKDSGESLDLFFDGQDEPFTIAKHGNDAMVAQLMPYVVPDGSQKLNEGGNDAYDPRSAARQAAIDAKKAEIAAQQAALDDQLVGLDAMAADEEYADIPAESESEAMAGADQERALAEASAARERELAAARAEGSADADFALASRSDAIERKRDQDKANIAWLNNQNAEIAAQNAAVAESARQQAENAAASIGAPAPAMVESDAAYAARQNKAFADKYNKENPSWRNSPAVGAPTYAVTTLGDSGNRSDAYLTDERADYDPLGRIMPAIKGAAGALGEFAQDIGLVRPAGEASAMALAAAGALRAPTDTSLSPEEQAMAQRTRGGRDTGKFEAFRTQAAGTGGASGSGSVAQKFAMSTKGGGGGVDTRVRPMPAQDTSLLEKQAANALAMGDLKAEAELAKARILEDDSIKRINVDKEYQDRLAQNQRNIDELDADIRNGKVDPNRLWSNMDGARQATMLVSLALGGLAQGASGFRTDNMALQTMNRMIDRDIEAQKDNLGRKESLLNMHMQQGRDLRSAWQMTKADMLTSLAAQLQAQAARSGSPQELKAAEAAALSLRQQAQQAQAQAEGAWRDDEFKRIEVQSQAALRGAQASALRIETALKVADAGRGPETGKNPPMEIAPGVIVQPADATSRQNLEKAVDAFNTMRNLVVEARAHRAKAGAQLIPRTADYVKANRLEKQLITALNNVENLGAFDKGTADLLGQIVPTVGGVYTPGVVDESLADLLSLAEKKFKTKVMTNVIPGTGLVSFTGAQSDFKPVGKAD